MPVSGHIIILLFLFLPEHTQQKFEGRTDIQVATKSFLVAVQLL